MSREGEIDQSSGPKRNILLTGATGFVGSALLARLCDDEGGLIRVVQRSGVIISDRAEIMQIENLTTVSDWSLALRGVDVVIHAAARAHVMKDSAVDPLSEFRRVNVDATLNLARQAAAAGVDRFVYLSSVKVNGEFTQLGQPFTETCSCSPEDPYGISKWEAEQGLKQIGEDTGLDIVIIRPPLVYGPGVRGNFLSLMKWVDRGVPLPLSGIQNKRSLVALDNLVDFIVTCSFHPKVANQVFLVSDDQDLSTTRLLEILAEALERPSRLFSVPQKMVECVARSIGKQAIAQRLFGSLQLNISNAREQLNWHPPVTPNEEIIKTVSWFRKSRIDIL